MFSRLGLDFNSFATGFFEQSMENKRNANLLQAKQLEKFQENQKELGTFVYDAMKDDLFKEGTDVSNIFERIQLGSIDSKAQIARYFDLAEDEASSLAYRGFRADGLESDYLLKFQTDEWNVKDLDEAQRGNLWFDTLNRQVNTPEGRLEAMRFFQNPRNKPALELLAGDARKYEVALRMNNRNQQVKGVQDSDFIDEIRFYDLEGNFGSAVSFLSELGLQSADGEVRERVSLERKRKENEHALYVNVYGTAAFGSETEYGLIITTNQRDQLRALAIGTGFKDEQQLADAFTYSGVFEYDRDKEKSEVAFEQNKFLLDAAKIYEKYGQYLAGQGSDPAMNKQFINALAVASGASEADIRNGNYNDVNRDAMTTILALLSPVPTDAQFIHPIKNVFANNDNYRTKSKLSVEAYAMKKFGIKDAQKFDESVSAGQDALILFDRLLELEDETTQTGAVRDLLGLTKGIAAQLAQVGKGFMAKSGISIGQFLDSEIEDNPFAETAAGTDSDSIAGVVNKLNREGAFDIDLANLTEIDAIKLTLAAKMARAVDPAGRLSNQDFEIQLRRLGSGKLITKEGILRNINLLKEEFSRDLEFKSYLNRLITDSTPLTQASARKINAYARLRGYEGEVFGGKIPYTEAERAQNNNQDTGGASAEVPKKDGQFDLAPFKPFESDALGNGNQATLDGGAEPVKFYTIPKDNDFGLPPDTYVFDSTVNNLVPALPLHQQGRLVRIQQGN